MLWTLYEHKSEPDGTYSEGAGQDECRANLRYFTEPTGIEFEADDIDDAEFHIQTHSVELGLEGKKYTLRLVTQSPRRVIRVRFTDWLEQQIKAAPIQVEGSEQVITVDLAQFPLVLVMTTKEVTFLNRRGNVVSSLPVKDGKGVCFSTRHHVYFMKGDLATAVPEPLPDQSLFLRLPEGLTEDQGELFAGQEA